MLYYIISILMKYNKSRLSGQEFAVFSVDLDRLKNNKIPR